MTKIEQIQQILGVKVDNIWGPKSQAAFDALIHGRFKTKASSFADPADIAAFRKCKEHGGSDDECFKVGDNGIGYWGDDTTTSTPMCALPPKVIIDRWGSLNHGRNKPVVVSANARGVTCTLADIMPDENDVIVAPRMVSRYAAHRRAMVAHAGIDLSPAACKALGLKPPVLVDAAWQWA